MSSDYYGSIVQSFAPGYIVKPEKDRDFYVRWSSGVGAPAWHGTRAEALAMGCDPERLERADKTGTSGLTPEWDDGNIIVAALGTLPRGRIAAYTVAWCDDRRDEAHAMLEPFEDEAEP